MKKGMWRTIREKISYIGIFRMLVLSLLSYVVFNFRGQLCFCGYKSYFYNHCFYNSKNMTSYNCFINYDS